MYHSNMMTILMQPFIGRRVPVIFGIRQSLYDISSEKRATRMVIRAGAKLSDRAARIVYNAHISAEQHEAIGYDRSRRVVIHNGFDCEQFKPDVDAGESLRRELGVPPAACLIGFFARYHPMKDHETFLRAAGMLHRTHADVHYVLAGEVVDSANRELVDQINENGIASVVHLTGIRRDVPRLNAGLDIASLTGKFEGFPNVIGEAMACGVPCVAVDSGETRAVIADTGRVVPARDPEALASAWREMLQIGPERRKYLGHRARQRVLDCFELGVITRRYEQLFDEVLDESPVAAGA
jgi:glycosyltransferase involved in cell wall biosynthesis